MKRKQIFELCQLQNKCFASVYLKVNILLYLILIYLKYLFCTVVLYCFANSQLPVTSTMGLIVLIFLTCFTEFTPARIMLVTEISLEDIFLYKGCGDPICNQVCWLKVS